MNGDRIRDDTEYVKTLSVDERLDWWRCLGNDDRVLWILRKHGFSEFESLVFIDYIEEHFDDTLKIIDEIR